MNTFSTVGPLVSLCLSPLNVGPSETRWNVEENEGTPRHHFEVVEVLQGLKPGGVVFFFFFFKASDRM